AAVDQALDREFLLEQLSGDVIEGGQSFWPEREESPKEATHSADSVDILRASGYTGEPLVLATIPQYENDALLVQRTLALSGVPVNIRLIPTEQFQGMERMSADLLLFAIMLDEQRELRLIDLFTSIAQHASPDLREMLQSSVGRILAEPDATRRAELFVEIERMLKAGHSLLFLYRKNLKTAFHPSVRGISLDSLGWVRFRDIWFSNQPV
ncbi:MAG: ABC transporter substrate-binding protein, partial [Gorillibacterium sp.]|nr:ABC transporter substrate-binding protein [Gorillibacterium sp.]